MDGYQGAHEDAHPHHKNGGTSEAFSLTVAGNWFTGFANVCRCIFKSINMLLLAEPRCFEGSRDEYQTISICNVRITIDGRGAECTADVMLLFSINEKHYKPACRGT